MPNISQICDYKFGQYFMIGVKYAENKSFCLVQIGDILMLSYIFKKFYFRIVVESVAFFKTCALDA